MYNKLQTEESEVKSVFFQTFSYSLNNSKERMNYILHQKAYCSFTENHPKAKSLS